ncbi:MAG: hypothetical protein M3015_09115 [Bacteroidota bacterium]|nr:hypothetical protein [Bacteroidota bacterium]
MDQAFIPECYVDTNLVETLVPPDTQYNHQKGCGTVAKVMRERFSDRFAVGIIDKDKRRIDYLKEFEELSHKESLILHKHKTKHHYIIQIYPAMERFLLLNAELCGVKMEDFDLPSDFEKLKDITKTVRSKNDIRFKRLFKALFERGSSDIKRISRWIQYLKETNYKAERDKLKEL